MSGEHKEQAPLTVGQILATEQDPFSLVADLDELAKDSGDSDIVQKQDDRAMPKKIEAYRKVMAGIVDYIETGGLEIPGAVRRLANGDIPKEHQVGYLTKEAEKLSTQSVTQRGEESKKTKSESRIIELIDAVALITVLSLSDRTENLNNALLLGSNVSERIEQLQREGMIEDKTADILRKDILSDVIARIAQKSI